MTTIQHVHAILDRSGSMQGKTEDVIGGLKANINELREKKTQGEQIFLSIKMFDNEQDILLPTVDLDTVDDSLITLTLRKYLPRGSTALRDALGDSLNYFMTQSKLGTHPNQSVMIYVMTDGLENASKNPMFSQPRLKAMIQEAEETCNISVYYIGANQDAILEADRYGIASGHAMNYAENSQSNEHAFRSLAAAAQRSRTGEDSSFSNLERSLSVQNE